MPSSLSCDMVVVDVVDVLLAMMMTSCVCVWREIRECVLSARCSTHKPVNEGKNCPRVRPVFALSVSLLSATPTFALFLVLVGWPVEMGRGCCCCLFVQGRLRGQQQLVVVVVVVVAMAGRGNNSKHLFCWLGEPHRAGRRELRLVVVVPSNE